MKKYNQDSPIALFDSGVGGLTIAKEVMAEFSNEDIIYFGDTAHLPYGPKSQQEVRAFVFKIIEYFVNLGAKIVIIACNTATAAGLKEARKKFDIPIIGPIVPGVREAVAKTRNNKIGVIATKGTMKSNSYQLALNKLAPQIDVFAKACPGFVPLVEAGELYTKEAKEIINNSLISLKEKEVDTLLLGCTHFPYLADLISDFMGQNVDLIYPGRGIALKVREILERENLLNQRDRIARRSFYVSDLNRLSKKFLSLGKQFLDFRELNFNELDIH